MRVVAVAALLCALLVVAVSAVETEDSAPVPEGFSLPNIFNPVLDHPYGRSQAKRLVHLVAKEPKIAFDVGGPEAPIEDMWNGEKDPISSASVAQLKMLKEVDSLTKLIDQGKKILRVLPRKQKRLALLKAKLSHILDAKAKKEASEKLDQQQALLHAIKKRETKMASRLKALKSSQSKLQGSVVKLQKVISDPKVTKKQLKRKQQQRKAHKKSQHKKQHKSQRKHKQAGQRRHSKQAGKPGQRHVKRNVRRGPNGEVLPAQAPAGAPQQVQQMQQQGAPAGAAHPRFAQMDSEADMESESELEAEQEAEQEAELDQEAGMEQEAEMEGGMEAEGEAGMEMEAGMEAGMEAEMGMEEGAGERDGYMY